MRKDGEEFHVEITVSPIRDAMERIVGASTIGRDISVRKAAEKQLLQMESDRRATDEALRESEERYRMLLDGVHDHAIFMMDPRGQIVSWNAGAERIKGYKAEEIIGHNFSCFFPPEDIESGRPEEVLRIAAACGRHEEQGMRVRKNGSRFLANVTITASRDPAGNLRGFSEFSHDISARKESEAKYRGLLEAAPDAMVVVNQGGEIVLLNLQAEKQFGYHRDELVGQKVKSIIPEGFAERLIADVSDLRKKRWRSRSVRGLSSPGDGRMEVSFPIEIMLSPLKSAEGILVTAAIRNVSVARAMSLTDDPFGRARLSDRFAQSNAPERPDHPSDRCRAALQEKSRGAVFGFRWLQTHQRLLGTSDRRQTSSIRRKAPSEVRPRLGHSKPTGGR